MQTVTRKGDQENGYVKDENDYQINLLYQ